MLQTKGRGRHAVGGEEASGGDHPVKRVATTGFSTLGRCLRPVPAEEWDDGDRGLVMSGRSGDRGR
jgi:hypothetical protein